MPGNCSWMASKQTVRAFSTCSSRIDNIFPTEMGPYYRSITAASTALPLDQELLDSMEKSNQDELKRLDERLADAEKTEGESEISDALRARANYLTRIGDKVCVILFFIPTLYHVRVPTGSSPGSPKARLRENTWTWISYRHRPYHFTHWILF